MTIREDQPAPTLSFPKNLPHAVDVHDRGTMNPNKLLRIKRAGKLLDRLPDQIALRADMQARIIAVCFNPLNLIDGDEDILCAVGYKDALRMCPWNQRAIAESGDHRLHLLLP